MLRLSNWLLSAALTLWCAGCKEGGAPDMGVECPMTGAPALEIGVPDSITFTDFQMLTDGGDIPLSSNGQTFLAVQAALRARNLSRFAHVGMTVTLGRGDGGATTTSVKDESMLERLFCRDGMRLFLVPVVVSAEPLGNDREITDKPVTIDMSVTDDQGREANARATGVLRRF